MPVSNMIDIIYSWLIKICVTFYIGPSAPHNYKDVQDIADIFALCFKHV